MDNHLKKCSMMDHTEIDAITFCFECKIYMCNKCENHHSLLFKRHHLYNLDKDLKEFFIGFCKEEKHYYNELKYFCRTHNQLCCVACISKIRDNENGQHKDCQVCSIDDIKEEKKTKLEENIKYLNSISNTLEQSINELKIIYDKLNENIEELKSKIQKDFTRIRNALNQREDELFEEVNKKFENLFIKDELIKKSEKFPNKLQTFLEQGSKIINEWNNEKIYFLINECLNFERNILDIKNVYESLKKCKLEKINIDFILEEKEINNILQSIKIFGKIDKKNDNINNFSFLKCQDNIEISRKYSITGDKENILTKTSKTGVYTGALCKNVFQKNKEYKWKIKILKTKGKRIYIGVSPTDFIISPTPTKYGWYLNCENSNLYSGSPYNYNSKHTNLSLVNDEVIVVMNMCKGSLKFIINEEDKGESYNDIPLDKPISPIVILIDKDDCVEINSC